MGGRGIRAVVGTGVVLLGVGLFVTGAGSDTVTSAVAGQEQPLGPSARDPADIRANNSPTIARNPRDPARLVVVNRVDTPRYSCAMHISGDGGGTWAETAIPFPAGGELPPRCFAPDAAFGPDGTLHLVFATLQGMGNSPGAVWASSSTDDGATLSEPVQVLGERAFQFRLAADPARPGRLYLSWLQAAELGVALFPGTGYPINVARSDDGGATWTAPVRVSPPSRLRVLAPSMAFGDGGRLYVLYLDVGDDRLDYNGGHGWQAGEPYQGTFSLVLARSDDAGATWQEAVVDAGVVPTTRFLVFLPQSPSLAVDPKSGRVHVGFSDGLLGDADIWVRTSTDGGSTFRPRVRVNDTPEGDGLTQNLPRLDVAPNGRLDVVYYDRRADRQDAFNEVSFQSSFDGGTTFAARHSLSRRTFDSRIGFGSRRGLPDLGSRLGLLSGDDRARAVWTDTRAGTPASNKQDLAQAAVVFVEQSSTRPALRVAGLAVVALGLALTLSAVLAPRRVGAAAETVDSAGASSPSATDHV